MKTIHRYALVGALTALTLKTSDKILHIGVKGDSEINLWVEKNSSSTAPELVRQFAIRATGEEFDDESNHLGTVILGNGGTVLHVYETLTLDTLFLAVLSGNNVKITEDQRKEINSKLITCRLRQTDDKWGIGSVCNKLEIIAQGNAGNLTKYGVAPPAQPDPFLAELLSLLTPIAGEDIEGDSDALAGLDEVAQETGTGNVVVGRGGATIVESPSELDIDPTTEQSYSTKGAEPGRFSSESPVEAGMPGE